MLIDVMSSCHPLFLPQEEEASIAVTGKGGEQTKMDVYWTRENLSNIDHVCRFYYMNKGTCTLFFVALTLHTIQYCKVLYFRGFYI